MNNHRKLLLAALCLACLPASARVNLTGPRDSASTVIIDNRPPLTGSGKIVTEPRAFAGARRIELRSAEPIRVRRGEQPRLSITGDDNLLPLIRTEVEGDTLIVEARDSYSARRPLRIEVTVPTLVGLSAPGGADAEIEAIDAERFELSIDGSSRVIAQGHTAELFADLNGSGEVRFDQVIAGEVHVRLNGDGDLHIHAVRELHAELNGSGDIVYRGTPKTLLVETNGSGRVRHP